jgi:hypothetical protein
MELIVGQSQFMNETDGANETFLMIPFLGSDGVFWGVDI